MALDDRSIVLSSKQEVGSLSERLEGLTYRNLKTGIESELQDFLSSNPVVSYAWQQASFTAEVLYPLPAYARSFIKLEDEQAVLPVLREILSNPEDYGYEEVRAKELLTKMETTLRDKDKQLKEELSKLDPETVDELGRYRAKKRWGEPEEQVPKVFRLKELGGLSDDEAVGMAAWVSYGDYGNLNKVVYAPDSLNPLEQLEARWANDQIAKAVAKLPKSDREVMEALKPSSSKGKWTPRGEYLRALDFSSQQELEAFVAPYKAAVGSTIQEQTHFAATAFSNHSFIEQGNLVFKVKAKDDGTGNSVTLDEYKNYAYEAEVFWAAGQNFKVVGVKETNWGYEVELAEEA